jgi:rRNA maturation protein Nop10
METSLFTCQYCGKDTSAVDYDYLVGVDHLSCALEAEKAAKQEEQNPFDLYEDCIMCGKKTTVSKTTHIDFRDGYIEGAGQLCIKCWNKDEEPIALDSHRNLFTVSEYTVLSTPNDQELGSKVRQLYWESKK